MKRFSVVLVTLAVILASQPVLAKRKCEVNHTVCAESSAQSGVTKLATLDNWKPFLPTDVIYSENDHVGKSCDKDGNYIEENTVYRCKLVQSKSAGLHYRIRRSQEEGDRIFVMKKNKPSLYVQFDGGGTVTSGSHVVVFASQQALNFAENNGYVIDKRNNTMVAKGSSKDNVQVAQPTPENSTAPQTANVADCASKTALLEKMKCIADNAAAMKK